MKLHSTCPIVLALIAAGLVITPCLQGDSLTSTWNGGIGSWRVASAWTRGVVPANSVQRVLNVVINAGAYDGVLDTNTTVNSLTLGGASGHSRLDANSNYPLLTVTHNATIGSSGVLDFGTSFAGNPGLLSVVRNFSNSGAINIAGGGLLSVGGNLTNSQSGKIFLYDQNSQFNVGGRIVNSGSLALGAGPNGAGPETARIGSLENRGYFESTAVITLANQPDGIKRIEAGSIWDVRNTIMAGDQNAFSGLTQVAGTLALNNGQATFVTPANASRSLVIRPEGQLQLSGNSSVSVNGNAVNQGIMQVGAADRNSGPGNALAISGTITNQSNSSIAVGDGESYSNLLTANRINNSGAISIASNSWAAVAGTLRNGGSVDLTPVNGLPTGGTLQVGSGVASSNGGYDQSADGVLEELIFGRSNYGTINAGKASLSGTLDILLGQGFTPTVGDSYKILTFAPGSLIGAFNAVEGNTFNNGLGRLNVLYDNSDGYVMLSAVSNVGSNAFASLDAAAAGATPEPPPALLLMLPLPALAWRALRRRHA